MEVSIVGDSCNHFRRIIFNTLNKIKLLFLFFGTEQQKHFISMPENSYYGLDSRAIFALAYG
jgi:hypothetical protein